MATQQGQPVSNLVHVQVLLGTPAAQGQNVDTMLILGNTPNVIDTSLRMKTYSTLNEVANDFGTTAPEYLAAQAWFSQSPQPITLNIGFWAKAAAGAHLSGARLSAAQQQIAQWNLVTAGGFFYLQNGVAHSISGLNFSSAANLNAVASAVQTAILAAGAPAGSTVKWDSDDAQFDIVAGDTGVLSTLSYMSPPTASGSLTFSGQPVPATDSVTLGGTAIAFVSGPPAAGQVQLGATLAATLTNLYNYCSASTDVNLVKFKYYPSPDGTHFYLSAAAPGVAGNSLTLTRAGTVITVSGATLTGGTGTDISAMMMAQQANGATISQGIAAETPLSAVVLLDDMYSNQWYGLAVLGASNPDLVAIAGYIEGANIKHYLTVTDMDPLVVQAAETSSLTYQLSQLKYNKSSAQYSSSNPYAGISYLARILTTNWEGNNTVITEMYKQEPGILAESLSTSQLKNITDKNGNVFVNYNNDTAIIQNGTCASGQYTDTIIGADWYAIQLQTEVFNLLYTTPTKIPQTDAGMNMIHAVLDAVSARAVNNGFLAPGTWQLPGFGTLTLGQYLSKGYYIFQPPIATQPASLRQTRVSVPFQIAAKLAGAVHTADITVTINQ